MYIETVSIETLNPQKTVDHFFQKPKKKQFFVFNLSWGEANEFCSPKR